MAARKAEACCVVSLVLMAAILFASLSRKSLTNDEIVHIPAGYYHLVAGQFQINNEHPPLVKMWAALPLLFIQPAEVAPSADDTWMYLNRFWPDNKDHVAALTFWPRAMMILIALGLGALIFVYARELFGARAAVLAVALYTLEPTVLAHGRLVHTDLPAALAFLLFFLALRHYSTARTLPRALLLGLASGVALAVKFSMIVLLPVLAGLALMVFVLEPPLGDSRPRTALHLATVVCAIVFVVNATYYFRSPPLEPADVRWVHTMTGPASASWMTFFDLGSKVVPTYFLFGQYNVMLHHRAGHPASLLGQYTSTGWWYYFPVAFALKTSLPSLVLSAAGLAWALWALWRGEWTALWLIAPLSVYTALSMASHINIGVRHFLPAYPFLFIAAGVLLDRVLRVTRARPLVVSLVVAIFGWIGVEAGRAYPDYIPYMNQLAYAHPHWWYLSDSNVEWGDDALALAEYLRARGENHVRGAVSGGGETLALHGIHYHEIFPKPGRALPDTRYVAIGASFLNGSTIAVPPDEHGHFLSDERRVNYLADYRTRAPEATFGHSIYLYRMKD